MDFSRHRAQPRPARERAGGGAPGGPGGRDWEPRRPWGERRQENLARGGRTEWGAPRAWFSWTAKRAGRGLTLVTSRGASSPHYTRDPPPNDTGPQVRGRPRGLGPISQRLGEVEWGVCTCVCVCVRHTVRRGKTGGPLDVGGGRGGPDTSVTEISVSEPKRRGDTEPQIRTPERTEQENRARTVKLPEWKGRRQELGYPSRLHSRGLKQYHMAHSHTQATWA